MKRRDFLHLAIATTAIGGARPLVARGQQTGPIGANSRIRAAIIGCGNRGRAVAREWIEHTDTTFVAACDVDKARTDATVAEFAQAGHKADGYEDYRRILERKDVDAVLIGTPDHWHSPMTIESIAAGKDIYCEKPVSNTVEAAVRMREAARKSNRIIQIGTQQRSWTHFIEAAALFHENYIGTTIRHIVMSPPGGGGGGAAPAMPQLTAAQMPAEPIPAGFNWDLFQGPAPRQPFLAARRGWRGWYAYGGGGVTDWGVHLVDVMAWFMKLDNKAPLLTSASAQYVEPGSGPAADPEHLRGDLAVREFRRHVVERDDAGGRASRGELRQLVLRQPWRDAGQPVRLRRSSERDRGRARRQGTRRRRQRRSRRGERHGRNACARTDSSDRAQESVESGRPLGSAQYRVCVRHEAARPQFPRQRQVTPEAGLRCGSGLRGVTAMPARERRDSAGAHREVGRQQGHVGAQASYFAFSFLVAVPDMTYAPPAKSIWALILPSAAGVSETTAGTALPW